MEIEIVNGFVKAPAGEYLVGTAQPVACEGRIGLYGLKGLFVADRGSLFRVLTKADAWFSNAGAPFLTRFDALPDEDLNFVSKKLLVAPFKTRTGARRVRPIPMSFRSSFAVTGLRMGWAVAATRSRIARITVEEGDTLSVRPEALVAWQGKDPTGFCARLGPLDLLLPRVPRGFALDFHGKSVVWIEGGEKSERIRRTRG